MFENFEFNKFSKSKHEIKIIFIVGLQIWNFISRANFIIPQKFKFRELIYIRKLILKILLQNEINKSYF